MDNPNQILFAHDIDLLGLEQIDFGHLSLWWKNAVLKFID